jgi:hypothetical protein
MDGLDLSKEVVNAVYTTANEKQKDSHMAATDLSQMEALAAKIADLGNKLIGETGNNWGEVLDAFNQTHYTQYDDPAFVDLREFCKKVLQEPNLQNINLIKNAAQAVVDGINAAIPMTKTNIAALTRGGLCIHFPYQNQLFDSANYVGLGFRSTNWHAFLSQFINSVGGGGGGNDTCIVTGTVNWPGHALSPNTKVYIDTVSGSSAYPILSAAVNQGSGAYGFQFTISADLQVVAEAWDDANGNQQFDAGDGWGFYDPNGDNQWTSDDLFTIGPGRTLQNININLTEQDSPSRPAFRP